jgi:SET domain-containing protein
MEFDKETISVRAVRDIEKGEELFINYNGVFNNGKKVWFEAV